MTTFEINDKEYELRLDLKGVKYLNGLYEGGAYLLIQKALSGDIDTYIEVIYAGLFHTGDNVRKKNIEKRVNELIAEEQLDLDEINRTMYKVVVDNFFYRRTVEKMFAADPGAKKQIENLMK